MTFSRYRDKYHFLLSLGKHVDVALKEHEQSCNKENCRYPEMIDVIKFTIGELIDDVTDFIEPDEHEGLLFTAEEKMNQSGTIDDIIAMLRETKAGNEILFEELQEMKII